MPHGKEKKLATVSTDIHVYYLLINYTSKKNDEILKRFETVKCEHKLVVYGQLLNEFLE